MNKKSIITAASCALVIAGCCKTPRVAQWDYKVVMSEVQTTLERDINNAASEGWQVVSASKFGGDGNAAFVILRREKK